MDEGGLVVKRLILLRHGKSDWDADAGSDHARPLARRGVRSAQAIGQVLARAGVVPDLVLTSPAVRAKTTAEIAAETGRWQCPIQVLPVLYGASSVDVVRIVREQPEELGSVMLVGHEPTWSATASLLTGGAAIQVKTATAVALDFASGWRGIAPGGGEVAWVLQPRLFLTDGWDWDREVGA